MATKKTQRYGIFVILVALVIGTLGSFAAMVVGTQNQQKESAKLQTLMNEYQEQNKTYQAKVTAQGDELSKQYYGIFSPYNAQVAEFDRDSVRDLAIEDLVVGDGEAITGTTKFAAYYIGWNPKGKVFDGSIDETNHKLKAPLPISTGLDTANLITGWKEGMKGMHIGGVRLITIPSDKAYGEQAKSDDIPANTSLKFVVMAIPAPAEIPQPQPSDELMRLYQGAQ